MRQRTRLLPALGIAALAVACGGGRFSVGGGGGGTTCGAAGSADACHPATLATEMMVTDLEVDAANVYLATMRGQVLSVPTRGGAPVVLATSSAAYNEAPSLALDDANVYFSGGGAVGSVPKSGGATVMLSTGEHPGLGFASSASALFWSEDYTDATCHCESGVIHRMSTGGGTPTALVSNLPMVMGLAADTASVYWIEGGAVKRVSLDGGDVTVLATGQSGAMGLSIDAANVYWTIDDAQIGTCGLCPPPAPPKATDTTIYSVPLGGGSVSTVATGYTVASVASDGANLYWLDTYAKTLSTVGVHGGTPTVLVAGEPGSLGPVVDDRAVYWVNTDGQIRRMSKTGM
jgi:hypothetical protein